MSSILFCQVNYYHSNSSVSSEIEHSNFSKFLNERNSFKNTDSVFAFWSATAERNIYLYLRTCFWPEQESSKSFAINRWWTKSFQILKIDCPLWTWNPQKKRQVSVVLISQISSEKKNIKREDMTFFFWKILHCWYIWRATEAPSLTQAVYAKGQNLKPPVSGTNRCFIKIKSGCQAEAGSFIDENILKLLN